MPEEKKLTRAEQKTLRPLQILEAAFEEFVKNGYSAARVEDVADRVGVTKGTVYVYFETKEKLFEAMIQHISTPFKEVLETSVTLKGRSAERLQQFLELLYGQLVDNRKTRELLRFVIAEGARFPDLIDRHHREFIAPILKKIQEILDEGAAAKEFPQKPAEFADVIMAPALAMIIIRLIFDDRHTMDRRSFRDEHLRMVLKGLTG
ncbi:TetR/AcrR family transcriptional regulator [Rhizobium sullae]|uniref:TetR family transcriptional regulator n=1 Tax=Rhizobium sullae TaxID=50338 RepID=A0A4R3PRK4_RHISU|nr:TetR/AcrR family transcriptional regulator [Rhizobium sullae]TCU06082.1 TetR family transcriptional regulator [Rhizobium sullae]UWU19188.1 TetR/AcrR family transcriptional regulator [Rhizobium sullae]